MLRGLTTVRYHAADLHAAKAWYTEFLGIEPYFDRPGYTEFRLGDYQHELGIMDSRFLGELGEGQGTAAPAGVVTYWHVDDVSATLDRLISLGATVREPIREFGDGFIGAAVEDPFGNILGFMQNAHYLEVLGAGAAAV